MQNNENRCMHFSFSEHSEKIKENIHYIKKEELRLEITVLFPMEYETQQKFSEKNELIGKNIPTFLNKLKIISLFGFVRIPNTVGTVIQQCSAMLASAKVSPNQISQFSITHYY